jgi:phage/plasmid-associated DNA primase
MWALEGLKRLRATRTFTIPDSSREALEEWRVYTSPIASFLQECTEPKSNGEVLRSELYDAWVKWAAERRIGAMTVGRFFERIRGSAPYVTTDSYERGGHKLNVFRGLSMKQWAAKQYLGRP